MKFVVMENDFPWLVMMETTLTVMDAQEIVILKLDTIALVVLLIHVTFARHSCLHP
jgi:hypothetical protein